MEENTSTANAERKDVNNKLTSLDNKRKNYKEVHVTKVNNKEVSSWLEEFFESTKVDCLSFDFKSNQRLANGDSPLRSSSADSIKRYLDSLINFSKARNTTIELVPRLERMRKTYKKKREAELEEIKKQEEEELAQAKKAKEAKEELENKNKSNELQIGNDN